MHGPLLTPDRQKIYVTLKTPRKSLNKANATIWYGRLCTTYRFTLNCVHIKVTERICLFYCVNC